MVPNSGRKPALLLVHGAFETAQVWSSVIPLLESRGWTAVAVDLPGRPGNPLEAKDATLALYRDKVLAEMTRLGNSVVLVGHSFGGFTIAAAAEARPESVARMVFLAAYLPQNGDSLVSLSQGDADSKAGALFRMSQEAMQAWIEPEGSGGLFANGCDLATQKAVAAGMVKEPLAPLATPVTLTERFARIPKSYVHTAADQVISPGLQERMVQPASGVSKRITLQTGHAPFAADPKGLAEALIAAALG